MTDEQKAAFIMAQAAVLFAETASMIAENQYRTGCGLSIIYGEEAFQKLINESLCTHNSVCEFFK